MTWKRHRQLSSLPHLSLVKSPCGSSSRYRLGKATKVIPEKTSDGLSEAAEILRAPWSWGTPHSGENLWLEGKGLNFPKASLQWKTAPRSCRRMDPPSASSPAWAAHCCWAAHFFREERGLFFSGKQ